jgi:hypothetical protein
MRILRIVLGLIVLVYALGSGAIAAGIAAFKLRAWTPPGWVTPKELQLAETIPWAQLVLWAAVVLLYLVVAIKLFRRVKTFVFWAAAFVLSAANWLWLRASPAYDSATPPNLANIDYYVLGASLAVGALILVLRRTHLD